MVEIPNIAGRTDQLYISMCSGTLILDLRSLILTRAGISNTGSARTDRLDWDVLTYAGDGVLAKKKRRREAKCAGFCAEQTRVFSDPERLECDEYPPGKSRMLAIRLVANAFQPCRPKADPAPFEPVFPRRRTVASKESVLGNL